MGAEIPYYLQPNVVQSAAPAVAKAAMASTNTVGSTIDTSWDWNYDYGKLPEPQATNSLWEEIADSGKSAGSAVWDTATGTWDSAKAGLSSIGGAIGDGISDVTGYAGGIFDGLLMRLVLIFAVVVIALIFLGKAGVIHDIAGVFTP